jgi:hypothetical protein
MYATQPYWCNTQWMYVPVCLPAPCTPSTIVPFELSVTGATSPQEALVGGSGAVRPTLEYLVAAGAAAPEVTVTITLDGTTTTWSESAIAEGYHVKDDFAAIEPGAVVRLEAVDATARLRWCERLCC